jgi:hypothetical protein
MNSSDLSTDPIAIIRRFWAANNILQNPNDLRDWMQLPSDVMSHVLDGLAANSSSSNLANLRLTCNVWTTCVNRHMDTMRLGWVDKFSGHYLSSAAGCAGRGLIDLLVPGWHKRMSSIGVSQTVAAAAAAQNEIDMCGH